MVVFVQTLEPDARLSVAPAGIFGLAAVPALLRVTVLPLEVTEVVGLLGGRGRCAGVLRV